MIATHEDEGGETLPVSVLSLSDDISSLPNNKIRGHAHGNVQLVA